MTSLSAYAMDKAQREWIEQQVADGTWIGLSVSIVEGKKADASAEFQVEFQVTHEHFGRTALDESVPPTDRTLYEIGSLTKAYTGIALACAVERGWVAYEDTISDHLPGSMVFSDATVGAITLLELATHTSGLPRLPGNLVIRDPLDPYRGYDEQSLLSFLSAFAPDRGLNKTYEYSNLGAGLLGYLLGRAASEDYAAVLETCVLAPLALTDTTLTPDPQQLARLAEPHANGARVKNWSLDILAGAGSLYATPADLARFARAVIDPPDNAVGRAITESLRPRVQVAEIGGSVGLGWHLRNGDGPRPIIWHNGGTGGYASALFIDPNERRAVIAITNSAGDVTSLASRLIAREPPPQTQALSLPPGALDDYLGWYELFEGFLIHVTRHEDTLLARALGQATLAMDPVAEDRFRYREVDAELAFHRRQDGKVVSLTLHQAGQRVPGRRVEPPEHAQGLTPIERTPEQLADFVGQYELTPQLTFDVAVREGRLGVQLTGQERYDCHPFEPDRCYYTVVDAQLTFERDETGQVIALVLHQNGVDQRAERVADTASEN